MQDLSSVYADHHRHFPADPTEDRCNRANRFSNTSIQIRRIIASKLQRNSARRSIISIL